MSPEPLLCPSPVAGMVGRPDAALLKSAVRRGSQRNRRLTKQCIAEGHRGARGHVFSADGECRLGAGGHLHWVVPQGCSEETVFNMSLGRGRGGSLPCPGSVSCMCETLTRELQKGASVVQGTAYDEVGEAGGRVLQSIWQATMGTLGLF